MTFKKISIYLILIIVLIFFFFNNKIHEKKIGDFYLMEIHNGIYYLYESDRESVIQEGILHHYKDKSYYILYGIDIEICDKNSIYFIMKDRIHYSVIDTKTNEILTFYDIHKFHDYAKNIDIKVKDVNSINEYLEKHPNNIDSAKKDGCILNE